MKYRQASIALSKWLGAENPEVEQQLDAILETDALLTEMSQVGHQVCCLARRQSVLIQGAGSLYAAVYLPLLQVASLDS
ncbi:hypothetical protein D9M69_699700 [compost metagenome]